MSCTSKCRMFKTRLPASRTTANASGKSSSSDSPFAKRCLNSAVLDRSWSSLREEIWCSSSLIFRTKGWTFLTSRSLLEPTNFLRNVSSIDEFNGKEQMKATGGGHLITDAYNRRLWQAIVGAGFQPARVG